MNKIEARLIDYGSPEYRAEVALRDEVLRKPLGLEFSVDDLAAESGATHVGAYSEGKLVGCLFLIAAGGGQIRMRQVAVALEWQGQGVGRALVKFAETYAKYNKFTEMILTARETALPFYRALGYSPASDIFVEIGIPHQKMGKRLF